MKAFLSKSCGMAVFCLAASYGSAGFSQTKDLVRPTATPGAAASQPSRPANGGTDEDAVRQTGVQPAADRAFDNKPPAGAREKCRRPQGGVDASGGENVNSSSKDNRACSGKPDKKSGRG